MGGTLRFSCTLRSSACPSSVRWLISASSLSSSAQRSHTSWPVTRCCKISVCERHTLANKDLLPHTFCFSATLHSTYVFQRVWIASLLQLYSCVCFLFRTVGSFSRGLHMSRMYACNCRLVSDSSPSLVLFGFGFGFVTAARAWTAVELEQPDANAKAAKQMSLKPAILKPLKHRVTMEYLVFASSSSLFALPCPCLSDDEGTLRGAVVAVQNGGVAGRVWHGST